MSILSEALRRARGNHSKWAQTLGASPEAMTRDRTTSLLPWLLCALLAALVAGLAVYIGLSPEGAGAPVAAPSSPQLSVTPKARIEPGRVVDTSKPAGTDVARAVVPATQHQSVKTSVQVEAALDVEPSEKASIAVAGSVHGPLSPPEPVTLAMLPDEVRRNFSAPRIVAHVWNADPALRFIIVDGRQLRVGDEITDGVRLVAITQNGQIVSFRGYRIRLR